MFSLPIGCRARISLLIGRNEYRMNINLKTFSKVRKGMLNAAEIAKQADAMLAEREQEMKELEQQKRRARDIMFKKTQQLKVRPPVL